MVDKPKNILYSSFKRKFCLNFQILHYDSYNYQKYCKKRSNSMTFTTKSLRLFWTYFWFFVVDILTYFFLTRLSYIWNGNYLEDYISNSYSVIVHFRLSSFNFSSELHFYEYYHSRFIILRYIEQGMYWHFFFLPIFPLKFANKSKLEPVFFYSSQYLHHTGLKGKSLNFSVTTCSHNFPLVV